MTTLAHRISSARKAANLSQTDLAKKVKVSRAAVGQWENGSTLKLEGGNLIAASKALGVNMEWLASGKGPMASANHNNVSEPTSSYEASNKVPVISWVQAGDWVEAIDNFYPGDAAEWVTVDGTIGDGAFALRVEGDSMTSPTPPSIPHGATIVVDPTASADHGCLVVAKLTDTNEVTFKRLVIDSPRRYLCGVVKKAVMIF